MTAAGLAASQDLHDFVSAYEGSYPDDVLNFPGPVPDSQDVTSVVWRLADGNRHEMLRFGDIAGIPFEVVTNVFACRRRISRMLGTDPESLHSVFQARARNLVEPVDVGWGPVLDEVTEVGRIDLRDFPMLTHFETDRAPYITSGIIVAEDRDGIGNLSYHRAMVHSPTELATSLHSRGDLWRLLKAAAERGGAAPGGDGARRASPVHAGCFRPGADDRRRAQRGGRPVRGASGGGAITRSTGSGFPPPPISSSRA